MLWIVFSWLSLPVTYLNKTTSPHCFTVSPLLSKSEWHPEPWNQRWANQNINNSNINKHKANTNLKISQAKTGWRKIKSSFKPADSLRWRNTGVMAGGFRVLSYSSYMVVSICSNYLKFKKEQDLWYLMHLAWTHLPVESMHYHSTSCIPLQHHSASVNISEHQWTSVNISEQPSSKSGKTCKASIHKPLFDRAAKRWVSCLSSHRDLSHKWRMRWTKIEDYR